MAPISGVVDHLRGTGTGQIKLDIIERIAEEHDDSTPMAFVAALIQHGRPINAVTIEKVQVYFGMVDAPDDVEPNDADLDEIASDPFDPDLIDDVEKEKKKSKKAGKKKKKAKKKKAKKKGKKQ